MRRFRIVCLLAVSASVPMLGQSEKSELFGGYSFERIAPGCGSNYRCGTSTAGVATNLSGWITSGTAYVYKSLGVSAQFTGGYNGTAVLSYSSLDRYTYQFGPAYAFPWRHASAFAHALFGGVTQGSSPDQSLKYKRFIWSVGGGLDLKASGHLYLRPVQVDYERQKVPVVDTGGPAPFPPVASSGLRYSAGIVLRF